MPPLGFTKTLMRDKQIKAQTAILYSIYKKRARRQVLRISLAHLKPKIVPDGVSLGIDLSMDLREGRKDMIGNDIQPSRNLMIRESLRKYSARCHY